MAMSEEHKAALAQGRREAAAIKRYLEVLAGRGRGRPANPENVKKRIAEFVARLEGESSVLRAVQLRQRIIDAEAALEQAKAVATLPVLEEGFIEHARSYSERKGISYQAWRQSGVPDAVLRKAGIPRSS